jgi:cell envelope opacity-associated protein A
MERVAAIKTLGKLLGKEMGYRVDPKAPTADERKEARERLPALTAERQRLEKLEMDRKVAVLAADQEYQAIRAARIKAAKAAQEVACTARSYKITVGNTMAGMFFSVKAEGDSWEEVIRKVKA